MRAAPRKAELEPDKEEREPHRAQWEVAEAALRVQPGPDKPAIDPRKARPEQQPVWVRVHRRARPEWAKPGLVPRRE